MKGPFERRRNGAMQLRLPAEGVAILSTFLSELRAQLGSDQPSHARLFPKTHDDPAEEARFQELTRGFLIEAKRGAVDQVLDVLERATTKRGVSEASLSDDEVAALLGSINDLRLVLGTTLGVTDEEQPRGFKDPSEPEAAATNAYLWLGAVQEGLLEVLLGEIGTDGTE